MKFVDEVRIRVQAGDGGNGCVSFRREKYVPRGGPDGGDGGRGGDVILVVVSNKHTLLDFRYRHLFKAARGRHGSGQNRHGRGGEDLVLEVPVGTVVKDPLGEEVLADLTESGQAWIAARGGSGGRGNARFVSSIRQVPRFAEEGRPGEEAEFVLELKLMADVGLVGFPNAGKSTLIAAVSAARPKIADYPFTTLVPNLGVVAFGDAPPFVMADIPGLIEGAHEGVGLGIRFLRHIERTRVLVHLIDVSELDESDPLKPLRQIESELSNYSEQLPLKERIIALKKAYLVPDGYKLERLAAAYRETGRSTVVVSALARKGLQDLLLLLTKIVNAPAQETDMG